MGHHPADVRFGKAAHGKGWVEREAARDAMRVVRVLRENGETTTLSRVLFEQDLLSSRQVRQLQQKLEQREALCECGSRVEAFKRKPGATVRCPDCKARVPVPGDDTRDPFKLPKIQASSRQGGAELALGAIAALGVAAVLGQAARESFGGHMGLGAAITSGAAGVLALAITVRGSALGGAGVLLAALSGLTVAAALGNPHSAPAYSAWGISAHQALPGLIALHVVLACVVLRQSLFPKGPDGLMPLVCLLGVYALGFFVYRCLPSSDPTHYLTGPSVLGKVPWFAQPGSAALLCLFPLSALALGGTALVRSLRKRSGGLVTHAGFVASLLVLSGFGVAAGTVGGQLPTSGHPTLERVLAHRVAPDWRPRKPQRASTAAAIAAAPEVLLADAEAGR